MANEKRLIDANALFSEMERRFCVNCNYFDGKCRECQYAEAADMLVDAPTVDAMEVIHGRWEDMWGGKYANPRYRCSVCKEKALYKQEQDELLTWHDVQALTLYCPNCGAKMDGGNEDG